MSLARPEATLFRVLSPYIDQIAEYMIRRWHTQPMIITEFCRIINIVPSVFVRSHLKANLPQFFAERQHRLLSKIASEVDSKPGIMLTENIHQVLARVFLLPTREETDRSLEFVAKYFGGPVGGRDAYTAPRLVRGQLAELIGTLVARLGDEDDQAVQAVRDSSPLRRPITET